MSTLITLPATEMNKIALQTATEHWNNVYDDLDNNPILLLKRGNKYTLQTRDPIDIHIKHEIVHYYCGFMDGIHSIANQIDIATEK